MVRLGNHTKGVNFRNSNRLRPRPGRFGFPTEPDSKQRTSRLQKPIENPCEPQKRTHSCHCCLLNCDFSDCYDSHDKRPHHKQLKTENPGLTTDQFCGNALSVETSTPQSASYLPSEILSQKSEKSEKSQFRLNIPRIARKIAKLTPMVRFPNRTGFAKRGTKLKNLLKLNDPTFFP